VDPQGSPSENQIEGDEVRPRRQLTVRSHALKLPGLNATPSCCPQAHDLLHHEAPRPTPNLPFSAAGEESTYSDRIGRLEQQMAGVGVLRLYMRHHLLCLRGEGP
jgi:hypothetical protein